MDSEMLRICAETMLNELETNYLEVVLIPAADQRHSGHCVRAVQYQNADWYRKFCTLYSSNRKGTKTRTRIKRRETITALRKILDGETKGIYVERILDFIDFENRKKKQIPCHDSQPLTLNGTNYYF